MRELKETLLELSTTVREKRMYPETDNARVRTMKKFIRGNKNYFRDSKIIYTSSYFIKDAFLGYLEREDAAGTMKSQFILDTLEGYIVVPAFTNNGSLRYMLLGKMVDAYVTSIEMLACDTEWSKPCVAKIATVRVYVKIRYQYFDGAASGDLCEAVHSYKRYPFIGKDPKSKNPYFEVPYPVFLRMLFRDVMNTMMTITFRPDIEPMSYLIRTDRMEGDVGRKMKKENIPSYSKRPIREYTDLLSCIAYAEFMEDVQLENNGKTRLPFCRVVF